jgi:protein-disulfide isomerase
MSIQDTKQGDFRVRGRTFDRISNWVLIVGIAVFLGAIVYGQARSVSNAAARVGSDSADRKGLGSKNAPITIEVFSDFECPACRNFYETSLKQVIDNYVNTGKVYLLHRDFPLPMHPYAVQAARLANAAAQLGDFERIEGALFDTQDQWSATGKIDEALGKVVSPALLKKIHEYEAQHLNEINASIEKDRSLGIQRNVNQTPTVYVTAHGKTEGLPGGGIEYKLLSQYLDYLLRQ